MTFKLEPKKFDFNFSDPRALFGLLTILYPFVSSLASISDASLVFNEFCWLEGLISQTQFLTNVQNYYISRGMRQIFKILGSTDMLGNPANLIEKVGSGFVELARDPIMGI